MERGYLTGYGVNAGDIDIEGSIDEIEPDFKAILSQDPIEISDQNDTTCLYFG
jgi:hypothetical protein